MCMGCAMRVQTKQKKEEIFCTCLDSHSGDSQNSQDSVRMQISRLRGDYSLQTLDGALDCGVRRVCVGINKAVVRWRGRGLESGGRLFARHALITNKWKEGTGNGGEGPKMSNRKGRTGRAQ